MVGDVLKRTRAIYGFKASEMSTKLGISNSYLSEIENNKKPPSLELLQKYSNVLGIKLSSLILLSENLDQASSKNRSQEFVGKVMMRLIDQMAKWDDADEETDEEEI